MLLSKLAPGAAIAGAPNLRLAITAVANVDSVAWLIEQGSRIRFEETVVLSDLDVHRMRRWIVVCSFYGLRIASTRRVRARRYDRC